MRIEDSKNQTKNRIGFIVMLVGVLALVAGLVFFLISIFSKPGLRDAEYLVEIGKWSREDEPTVIWNFTEVGKGTLTTNSHTNDYEFIWAIEDDTLKIETKWLYELNDTYAYKLDQGSKTLTLNPGENEIKFVPYEEKPETTPEPEPQEEQPAQEAEAQE